MSNARHQKGQIVLSIVACVALIFLIPPYWSLAQSEGQLAKSKELVEALKERIRQLEKKITVTEGTVVTVYHKCVDVVVHPETGAVSFDGRKGSCDAVVGTYVFGGGGSTKIEIVPEDSCE